MRFSCLEHLSSSLVKQQFALVLECTSFHDLGSSLDEKIQDFDELLCYPSILCELNNLIIFFFNFFSCFSASSRYSLFIEEL